MLVAQYRSQDFEKRTTTDGRQASVKTKHQQLMRECHIHDNFQYTISITEPSLILQNHTYIVAHDRHELTELETVDFGESA